MIKDPEINVSNLYFDNIIKYLRNKLAAKCLPRFSSRFLIRVSEDSFNVVLVYLRRRVFIAYGGDD